MEEQIIGVGTVPKKRGRPAKINKIKKPPTGRGRGRPAKNAVSPKKSVSEVSDEEFEKNATNGGNDVSPSVGRGRPPKQAKLIPAAAAPKRTAKGRGRPKKQAKSDQDDDESVEDDDDEQSSDYKPSGSHAIPKKKAKLTLAKAKPTKKPGRPPKKAPESEEEDDASSDDDFNEAEVVGMRPMMLSASRPQAGRGRKIVIPALSAANVKRTTMDNNGDAVKKRGRPALNKSVSAPAPAPAPVSTPSATGGARGRPKVNVNETVEDSMEDDDDADDDDDDGSSMEKATLKDDKFDENSEDDDNDAVILSNGEDDLSP